MYCTAYYTDRGMHYNSKAEQGPLFNGSNHPGCWNNGSLGKTIPYMEMQKTRIKNLMYFKETFCLIFIRDLQTGLIKDIRDISKEEK